MIDFLKKANISDEVILSIMNNYNDAILYNLSCNADNCLEIINYLKELNIEVIDELLLNRIDLFLNTKEDIVKKFSKYNIPLVVDLINDDYVTIDKI